jgi:hypothetical protein
MAAPLLHLIGLGASASSAKASIVARRSVAPAAADAMSQRAALSQVAAPRCEWRWVAWMLTKLRDDAPWRIFQEAADGLVLTPFHRDLGYDQFANSSKLRKPKKNPEPGSSSEKGESYGHVRRGRQKQKHNDRRSSGGGNPRDHLPLHSGPFVRNSLRRRIHPSL